MQPFGAKVENMLLWYPHFLLFFSHPTFRIGGPMEYLRGLRVERSVEMGRGYKKKATDVSMTTMYMVIQQTSWRSMHALNT